ncbi:MAG: hybrid sensor histidine kinase/response regulator [Candidatus Wallbacteria bacterium]
MAEQNLNVDEGINKQNSELERIKKELRKIDSIKSDLLESLCHELRTPLASIRGYTELVYKGKMGEVNEKQNKALSIVLKNVDKMLVLIDELSAFSKVQNFTESQNIRKLDVTNVIQEVIAALAGKCIEKKVEINLNHKMPAFINGDYSQVSFVLSHLIDSVIKSKTENQHVDVCFETGVNKVIITIKNIGGDLANENVIKFLNSYSDNDAPMGINPPGISVELSMITEIIKMHRGSICIVDAGTNEAVLKMEFPAFIEMASLEGQAALVSGHKKILIADDDPDCVGLLKTLLESDYNVIVAYSAQDMYKTLAEHKDFGLILLDINMLESDGITICRTLKEKPEYADIPILMISASLQEQKKQKSLEAGAIGFLEKPFEAEKISQLIGAIVK